MIVMDVKMDNFLLFKNFHMNMSYPKKIVDSCISNEFLQGRKNFRYKKINIIMGANATGKTSIGKMLMRIFNFMDKKQYERITDHIFDTGREASFSIDFVVRDFVLYRVQTLILPKVEDEYQMSDINVIVKSVAINPRDSYEMCAKRLDEQKTVNSGNYIEELEKIKGLSWMFKYPREGANSIGNIPMGKDIDLYLQVMSNILKVLDPAIITVEKSDEIDNTYIIRYINRTVIIQDGRLIDSDILSSGTKAGIEVASILTSMMEGKYGFYYCDEKFSYIHSDIEKAILSVMINRINENEQLFFTTHNTNILDLPLPKHSFVFLKKDMQDSDMPIKCISASSLLKRNTDCLKNAVENDLFSVAPNIELIYDLDNA